MGKNNGFENGTASGEMPIPPALDGNAAASTPEGMPLPAMGGSSGAAGATGSAGAAPAAGATGATVRAGSDNIMPPAPGGQQAGEMPRPSFTSMGEGDGLSPRIAPPRSAGAPSGPRYEPGVIEVQFRDGLMPSLHQSSPAAAPEVRSAAGTALAPFNQVMNRHGLVRAEPTFLTTPQAATTAQTAARAKGMDVPHLSDFMTLHFPGDADVNVIASELRALPEVAKAVPVPIAIPPAMPNIEPQPAFAPRERRALPQGPIDEPLVGTGDQVVVDPITGLESQWYIFRCHANAAWRQATGRDVVIADVDWGYRTSHEDLAHKIDRTYNAFDGTAEVSVGGSVSHGTAVLGITGAASNGRGIAGFAPDARLWAIQADSGTGPELGGNPWARGIDWVRTTDSGGRRKVVILEVQTGAFGNYEQVPSVNAAIRTAIASGVIVCVAAGNGDRDAGIDDSGNPIDQTGSILVGATAYDAAQNTRAWFSNYGPRITVSAPGDSSHDLTCSDASDTAYRNGFGGTSGATPKVAGVAALLLQKDPSLSHEQIRTILRNTGTAVVTDAAKPVGTFLNAEAACLQAGLSTVSRIEIFARGADQAVYHIWQTAPNNGWSGWASLGGWVDRISSGRNADGRLEIFARGSDQALYHRWQTSPGGGWSNWASLGGWVDLLCVGRNADGRLEVFARGSDGALWHKWQTAPNDGWSDWASLGGWIDRLFVEQNADGRLEVFARGSDGALWHKWQTAPNDGWSDWASLGGWVDDVCVGKNADGRLEVFARGSDGALWHKWQTAPNNGWSAWASLGGWIDRLAVGKNADGRLEVFARGSDGALWHKWQTAPNGGWSDWASLGGWVDLVTVTYNADGRLELFVRGSDRALYHKWQTAPNNGWSNWTSLGGWVDLIRPDQNA